MNDLIRLVCERAVQRFSHDPKNLKVFNGAGFSQALVAMGSTTTQIDGHIVRMILTGRDDVQILAGGAHYRLIENGPMPGGE